MAIYNRQGRGRAMKAQAKSQGRYCTATTLQDLNGSLFFYSHS